MMSRPRRGRGRSGGEGMVYYVRSDNIPIGSYDRMPDDPMQPWFETHFFPPFEDWQCEYFPSRYTFHPAVPKPPDVVVFRYWGVCEGIKEIIESVELGVHQFIPFKLIYGPENDRIELQYYTLAIGCWLEAINLEKSDVKISEKSDATGNPLYWMKKRNVPLVLKKEMIGDHHLWVNSRRQTFFSTALHDRLIAADLGSGWKFEKQIVT